MCPIVFSCCPCWFTPETSIQSTINETMEREYSDEDASNLDADYYATQGVESTGFTPLLLSNYDDSDGEDRLTKEEKMIRNTRHIPPPLYYYDPTY